MLTVFALATAVMRTPGAETNAPGDRFRLALAIVLAIYRNRRSVDLDELDLMRG